MIPLPECSWLQTEKRPLTEYPCQWPLFVIIQNSGITPL
ncbi:hypothetical protein BACCAP_02169 [Pseudoflavonifractor capillosus ATCC 29799]|uniref:Uncharacterized protein n=1 Tax=Pseudoflavonifractor capillosus ATCC 29799 TaxID=411467 RepID=A6NVD4_9FIRM|nr:hypothetical protein BACCAP_02169 [Pseudoflavonifractor capillosus ATCC 29799]